MTAAQYATISGDLQLIAVLLTAILFCIGVSLVLNALK
jgi:hypothetical protein